MNPGNDIVKELQEMKSPLADMPRTTPFAVPADYFATLSVDAIIKDQDPVLNLPKEMPFDVPEGYFSSFSVAALMQDQEEQEPVLNLPKSMPFDVPQGYFESFSANIVDKVAEPSFGKIAAPAFDAPAGYFDGFADRMLAAAKAADAPKQATKVIDFRPQWQSIRWAAAAMLVLSIGIGSFMKFGDRAITATPVSASKQLAQLDKGLIRSYVQQHIDEFDTDLLAENSAVLNQSPEKNIDKLQEQDIRQYLEDGELGDSGLN